MTIFLQLVTIALLIWVLASRTQAKPRALSGHTSTLLKRAVMLTQDVEHIHLSGEAKRHQVYARLIKEFPDVARRQLSRTIEEALDAWR